MAASPNSFDESQYARGVSACIPQLDELAPAALTTWFAERSACTLPLADAALAFEWLDASSVTTESFELAIELVAGADRVLIQLTHLAALEPLYVGEPFTLLPTPLKDLIVHKVVASLLARGPRSLAEIVQIRAIHWRTDASAQWPVRLGFALERQPSGAVSRGLFAVDSSAALLRLHEQLPRRQAVRLATQALPLALRFVIGHALLSTSTLRTLGTGDVVWLTSARMRRDGLQAAVYVGRRCFARASLRHRDITLTHLDRTALMQSETPAHATAQSTHTSAATPARLNIEVPLTFDVGELQLPLAELERLEPGALLDLQHEVADAAINIRAPGMLIARGQLVAIGKRLGVRITQLYLERESA